MYWVLFVPTFVATQNLSDSKVAICNTRLPPGGSTSFYIRLSLYVDMVSAHEILTERRYPDAPSQFLSCVGNIHISSELFFKEAWHVSTAEMGVYLFC